MQQAGRDSQLGTGKRKGLPLLQGAGADPSDRPGGVEVAPPPSIILPQLSHPHLCDLIVFDLTASRRERSLQT